MSRIKPGMVCLIVGEVAGCECNIGAQVTVTECEVERDCKYWLFTGASRPLKMLGRVSEAWLLSSSEHPNYPDSCWVLQDRHLVPLLPPEQAQAVPTSQDLELTA